MTVDEDAVGAIATEICSYLAAHPGAADSVAGIHRWWLPRKFAEQRSTMVEQALDRLVAAGLVRVRYLPDGASVYGSIGATPSALRQRGGRKMEGDDKCK